MKAAFAAWDNRIAPVFDVAREVRLVEARGGRIVSVEPGPLAAQSPAQRALHLVELGAGTLVCGAISRTMQSLIASHGIRVIPFVAGDLDEVIAAWVAGGLQSGDYDMPGCCRRARRWRQRRGAAQEEDPMQNDGGGHSQGQGRGAGQGQGRGRGAGQGQGAGRGQGGGRGAGRGLGQGGSPRGRQGGPVAAGPDGMCVCAHCGHELKHERGTPCAQIPCPRCGGLMTRR